MDSNKDFLFGDFWTKLSNLLFPTIVTELRDFSIWIFITTVCFKWVARSLISWNKISSARLWKKPFQSRDTQKKKKHARTKVTTTYAKNQLNEENKESFVWDKFFVRCAAAAVRLCCARRNYELDPGTFDCNIFLVKRTWAAAEYE